jgi:hypothetical protein
MPKSSPLNGRIGSRFGGRGARKQTRIFAALITFIAVGYFGTTLAASISLGSDSPLEFGQGSRAAVACDETGGIETAIEEKWNNDTVYFKVDKIILSNVDNRVTDPETGFGCQGKTIKVRLMDVDGPLTIGSSSTLISFVLGSEDVSNVVGATVGDITVGSSGEAGTITITLPVLLDASTVTRVALETE